MRSIVSVILRSVVEGSSYLQRLMINTNYILGDVNFEVINLVNPFMQKGIIIDS